MRGKEKEPKTASKSLRDSDKIGIGGEKYQSEPKWNRGRKQEENMHKGNGGLSNMQAA